MVISEVESPDYAGDDRASPTAALRRRQPLVIESIEPKAHELRQQWSQASRPQVVVFRRMRELSPRMLSTLLEMKQAIDFRGQHFSVVICINYTITFYN